MASILPYHEREDDCVDRLVEAQGEGVPLLLNDVAKRGPSRLMMGRGQERCGEVQVRARGESKVQSSEHAETEEDEKQKAPTYLPDHSVVDVESLRHELWGALHQFCQGWTGDMLFNFFKEGSLLQFNPSICRLTTPLDRPMHPHRSTPRYRC